jgi:predicted neutral ceramidase superfamily lipid hydrolase
MKKLLFIDLSTLRKYFSEKNALTVVTSLFCLIMIVVSIAKEDLWLSLAFALAFSFSVEVICHRVKENKS